MLIVKPPGEITFSPGMAAADTDNKVSLACLTEPFNPNLYDRAGTTPTHGWLGGHWDSLAVPLLAERLGLIVPY